MTIEETASVLSVSPGTVRRDWRMARAWLYRELTSETQNGGGGTNHYQVGNGNSE